MSVFDTRNEKNGKIHDSAPQLVEIIQTKKTHRHPV